MCFCFSNVFNTCNWVFLHGGSISIIEHLLPPPFYKGCKLGTSKCVSTTTVFKCIFTLCSKMEMLEIQKKKVEITQKRFYSWLTDSKQIMTYMKYVTLWGDWNVAQINTWNKLKCQLSSHFPRGFITVWGLTGTLLITSSHCTLFFSSDLRQWA